MGYLDSNDFRTVHFPKTGQEIKDKCVDRIAKIEERIKIREATIKELLEKFGLSTMDVMEFMESEDQSGAFSNSTRVARGNSAAPNNGMRIKDWEQVSGESKRRTDEITELARVKLVHRNLDVKETYKLTFSDLEYYEF